MSENYNIRRERRIYIGCIIGLVVLLLLLHRCGDSNKGGESKTTIVTTVDSVYVKGAPDTVFFEVERPYYVAVEKERIVYVDTTDPEDPQERIRIYTSPFEDSLISGTISTELSLGSCLLRKQGFKYIPKFPKYINRVDTIKIDRTTTITTVMLENKLLLGGEVGGNKDMFSFGPRISLMTKKDNQFSYRYDILNKTHNVGFSLRILKW